MVTAVTTSIKSWNLEVIVRAIRFDKTVSHPGHTNGACALRQEKLGKELVSSVCLQ